MMLRSLGLVPLVLGGLAVFAAPAGAHAELVATVPAYDATVAGLERVVVRYELPVGLRGAEATLVDGSGRGLRVGRPAFASADHREVAWPLPELAAGRHVFTWFLLGSDGDVMGGELPFTVVPAAAPVAPASPPATEVRPLAASSSRAAPDQFPLLRFASLTLLVGGVPVVARSWPERASAARGRALIAGALGIAVVAAAALLGRSPPS
jgi:methionine-rich copper-binding protein CopC